MPSTSSSAERPASGPSATEVLASRYRHLFVLPSTLTLVLYNGVATFLLSVTARGYPGIVIFWLALGVALLAVTAVSSALYLIDSGTLANFRRTNSVILAGTMIWLLCVACGELFSLLSGYAVAVSNAFIFGAFLCAGFEFLVIGGAFTQRLPLSFGLAALHPAFTLAVLRFPEVIQFADPLPYVMGGAAFIILTGFVILLRNRKTSKGYSGIRLFQAFMKTWAGQSPDDLESIIVAHSKVAELSSKILRFSHGGKETYIVLPGVHPGPFHLVGSYELPGAITRAFTGVGSVLVLHRPGGHERNLASKADTLRFADQLRDYAKGIALGEGDPMIRGPVRRRIGDATVSGTAVSDESVVTVTFSPLGSDDIDASVESRLQGLAAAEGLQASIVDAHNSIDNAQMTLTVDDMAWSGFFEELKAAPAHRFKIAYSSSTETGLAKSEDLTENGIGLMMFEIDGSRQVLVLADANNAAPALRGTVERALESAGYGLIELCTSDSHDLAARGLTVSRGYKALGESTPPEKLAEVIVDLAQRAEARLTETRFGAGNLVTELRVFGEEALEEFAGMTQRSSKLGGNYLRLGSAAVVALLVLSLVL